MFRNETNLCQMKTHPSALMDSTGMIIKWYVLINTIKQKLSNNRHVCADRAKLFDCTFLSRTSQCSEINQVSHKENMAFLRTKQILTYVPKISCGKFIESIMVCRFSPNIFQFHAVFQKMCQNCMLAPPCRVSGPSDGDPWIRPCIIKDLLP